MCPPIPVLKFVKRVKTREVVGEGIMDGSEPITYHLNAPDHCPPELGMGCSGAGNPGGTTVDVACQVVSPLRESVVLAGQIILYTKNRFRQ